MGEHTTDTMAPPPPGGTPDGAPAERRHTHRADTALLPARMLNEFVYCPRLFYLEHVEGVFVHNADTIDGRAAHDRVDKESRDLDPDATEPERLHTRSVSLFSDTLGVTAKLDLVESTPDSDGPPVHRPVEYKKGKPRSDDDGIAIWDADRMQLGLQILLLRENGFRCDQGLLYYRETRQQVALDWSPDLDDWIRARVTAARTLATAGSRPPPLDDSPKCPRCSLVGVCLPDETRLLAEFSHHRARPPAAQLDLTFDTPLDNPARLEANPFADFPEVRLPAPKPSSDIRRLIAPDIDNRALYLHQPGVHLGKKDETLVAKEKGKKIADFRLIDIHHIAVFGPVQISTAVVQTACERDIPISYFSMGGWFYGMTRGHGLKNVLTRIAQFEAAADPHRAIGIARRFVHGKIRNQRTLLLRNHTSPPRDTLRDLKTLASLALVSATTPSLLGIEGNAARLYFSSFSGMLKRKDDDGHASGADDSAAALFHFDGRNRRPPRDPVNALLSMAYALLAKDCTIAAWSAGFDPYVGFLHQPRFGRPALALDVMEEFRPIIADSVVLTMINNNMLDDRDFVRAGQAVTLAAQGRRKLFEAYEKRLHDPILHPVFGYRVSYRRALELQFRLLAKVLDGEIEAYFPFTTR